MLFDPFIPFRAWLKFLDSHDGLLYRRRCKGGLETDSHCAALIPTPPGQTIFTVGDLRALVAVADRVHQLEEENSRLREGEFTEEEFQRLCHNLTADDLTRFRAGCRDYQCRLFGEARVLEAESK